MNSFDYFFGMPGDVYSPIEMMLWLLMWLPAWGMSGYLISKAKERKGLVLYRLRKKSIWWHRICVRTGLWCVIYFTLLFLTVTLYALHCHEAFDWGESLKILLTLTCHSLTCAAVMLWVYVLWKRSTASFVVMLVLEAVSTFPVLAGWPPVWCPPVWGMYGYSIDEYRFGGFNLAAVCIIQLIWWILTWLVPPKLKRFLDPVREQIHQ